MASLPTLFFDVGGVLLTNAWDTEARRRAAEKFQIDYQEFQTRHEMLKTGFETGRVSLDAYIRKAVFFHPRPFTPQDFKEFMFAQSQLLGGTLEWVKALAQSSCCRLYTLNNESRELHEYRVRTFGLHQVFLGFLTSCYLGQAKPDEGMYRNALGIAACESHDAIFIDDRALNVESAEALGLTALRFTGLDPLRDALRPRGIIV